MGKIGQLAFGVAGGFIGGLFTAGAFSPLGFAIGSSIGGGVFGDKPGAPSFDPKQLENQLSDYGVPIPRVYGGLLTSGARGGIRKSVNLIDCPPDGGLSRVAPRRGGGGGTGGSFADPGPTGDDYNFYLSVAGGVCEGPAIIDQVGAGEYVIYDRWGASASLRGYELVSDGHGGETSEVLRLYQGRRDQQIDTAQQEWHPEGCSADRGLCKFVLNGYPLKRHNNQIPTFWVKVRHADNIITIHDMIVAEFIYAGLPSDTYDLANIAALGTGGEIEAAIINGHEGSRDFCEKLADYAGCGLGYVGGKIVDYSLADPVIYTIQESERGARLVAGGGANGNGSNGTAPEGSGGNNGSTQKTRITVEDAADAPTSLTGSWIDPGLNYEVNSVTVQAQVEVAPEVGADITGDSSNQPTIAMPLVSDAGRMAQYIDRKLYEARAGRRPMEESLPPGRVRAATGDVLEVTTASGIRHFRIEEQTIGAPGPLVCKGHSYDPRVYNNAGVGVAIIERPPPAVNEYLPPDGFWADTVALDDQMAARPGPIVAATSPAQYLWTTANWDGRGDAIPFTRLPLRATMGVQQGDVGPEFPTGSIYGFDYGSTLQLSMIYGEPGTPGGTAEEAEAIVRAGGNAMLSETGHVIKFLEATEVSPGLFDLTGILWGVKGSDFAGPGAGGVIPSGTKWLLLSDETGEVSPAWKWVPMRLSDIGRAYAGEFESDGDASQDSPGIWTLRGNSLKPLSVVHIAKESDGAGGYVLGFNTRTRLESRDGLSEAPESDPGDFEIVLQSAGVAVDTRRFTSTSNPVQTTYTAAELTAIFGSVPATLSGTIYQINRLVGRGWPASFTNL